MAHVILEISEEIEARIVRLAERPIDFETFLNLNVDHDMELIDGVMVKKVAAQLDHERLLAWLFWLLYGYTEPKNLGLVLGSRTAIQIDEHHGRMPDLLFVRQENIAIVHQRAIYGTPDMTMELISPNDRASDIIAVETDYCKIGVPEIVFIDQKKKRVRVLRKRETEYVETLLTEGELALESVPGFVLQAEWLFAETRPDKSDLLRRLLSA